MKILLLALLALAPATAGCNHATPLPMPDASAPAPTSCHERLLLDWSLPTTTRPTEDAGAAPFQVPAWASSLRVEAHSGPHVHATWSFRVHNATGALVYQWGPFAPTTAVGRDNNVPPPQELDATPGVHAFEWTTTGAILDLNLTVTARGCPS